MTYYLIPVTEQSDSFTLGRTRKVRPHRGTRGGGRLMDPLVSGYVAIFRNDFAFSGKFLIFSTR